MADLTASIYLFSSGRNALGESRALEGRRVKERGPSRIRDGDGGVTGRNGIEKCFLSMAAGLLIFFTYLASLIFDCLEMPCSYNEKILLSRLWWSDLVRVAVEAEVRL